MRLKRSIIAVAIWAMLVSGEIVMAQHPRDMAADRADAWEAEESARDRTPLTKEQIRDNRIFLIGLVILVVGFFVWVSMSGEKKDQTGKANADSKKTDHQT